MNSIIILNANVSISQLLSLIPSNLIEEEDKEILFKPRMIVRPNVEIREGRRVGNTTRIVDGSIDVLHQDHILAVVDHYNNKGAVTVLRDKIIKRFNLESNHFHNSVLLYKYYAGYDTLTIVPTYILTKYAEKETRYM